MGAELAIALHRLGGVSRGFLCGGHLSAAIVAEMAIAEPERWPSIVLDGSPTLTREQFGVLMASFADLSPKWSDDGRHESFAWRMTERFLHEWNPEYRASPENFAVHYAYMADYLQMGFAPIRAFIEPGSGKPGGLATYDALARWPLIRSRTLALTAEREALRVGHEAALARLATHVSHEFPGVHPLLVPARAAEYVAIIANFLQA